MNLFDTITVNRTMLNSVIETQLEALDDTDAYASAWSDALKKEKSTGKLVWGGRGRGGRGRARKTLQPKDVVVDDVRLEYVGNRGSVKPRILLENTCLKILPGRVYAVVARNGSGKSTLLRRIHAGKIPGFPPHISTLYIPQELVLDIDRKKSPGTEVSTLSPLEYVSIKVRAHLRTSSLAVTSKIEELEKAMDELNLELEEDQFAMEELANRISILEDERENDAASDVVDQALQALEFMGINGRFAETSLESLSAGYRRKTALAVALICSCDILLLDEPTNSLDISGLLRIRELIYDCQSRGASVVLVSHDRDLVDEVATDTIEIQRKSLHYNAGNYSELLFYKQQNDTHALKEAAALEKKHGAMMQTLENLKKQAVPKRGGAKKKAKQVESQKKKIEREGLTKDDKGHRWKDQKMGTGIRLGSINALDAANRKGRSTRQLLELARTSIQPIPDKAVQFIFKDSSSRWSAPLITLTDVGHRHSIGVSPPSESDVSAASPPLQDTNDDGELVITRKPGFLFDSIDLCIDEGKRYCILGHSSSGKSTLLKILSGRLKPTEGTIRYALNVDISVLEQTEIDGLIDAGKNKNALEFLMSRFPKQTEQDVRGELSAFGINPTQARTELQFLSGGERCRVFLAYLMIERPQVLILDQPTANLDLESVSALVHGLLRWKGTVIMSTHDTNFLREMDATCYALIPQEGKLRYVKGGVDEYLNSFY